MIDGKIGIDWCRFQLKVSFVDVETGDDYKAYFWSSMWYSPVTRGDPS